MIIITYRGKRAGKAFGRQYYELEVKVFENDVQNSALQNMQYFLAGNELLELSIYQGSPCDQNGCAIK